MERRSHILITPKELSKSYYYTEWDVCPPCKHVQHYDKYKIMNKNEKSEYLRHRGEIKEMDSLFKNL